MNLEPISESLFEVIYIGPEAQFQKNIFYNITRTGIKTNNENFQLLFKKKINSSHQLTNNYYSCRVYKLKF